MKIITTGSTRLVILIGNLAIKIPAFHSWKHFLLGLLSNMQESEFSKCIDMKDKLCPIKFYLPLGLLIAMPRVDVLKENELSDVFLKNFISCNENYAIPVEIKHDSFGYLNNKLVAIDYGS